VRGLALPILAILLLSFPGTPFPADAGDEPFTFPSNIGLTGLLETPTARVMKEDRYRVGAIQVHPYRTWFATVGLFERLEVNGRITEILGVPAFTQISSAYGNDKDKAIDVKLQLLPEGKYTPAVALAILDPHGTRLFPSQAIVASKQIYPFDFTMGLGNGRLGKRALPSRGEGFGLELFGNPRGWWHDAQLFGGVQFALSDRFALVAEYSPVRYERQTGDPAQKKYFPGPVPSRINAGLRWKPTRWSSIHASFERGNEVGIGASVAFDVGKPMIPVYDPPWRERPGRRQDPTTDRIAAGLHESGFSDIGVTIDGLTLRVEAQNDRYFFNARAIEAALDILARTIPPNVDYVRILIKDNGIPLLEFVTTASGVAGLYSGEIPRDRFLELSAFKADTGDAQARETLGRRRLTFGAKPSLETFLNDPSGFLKYRFGVAGWLTAHPWKGGSAILGLEGYPLNTVSTSVAPLSIPVRSDIAEYKKEDVALGRLMFEQIGKTRDPVYARISAGLLEVEYAGVDGEVAMPFFRGRVLAGAGGSAARKRDPRDPFALRGSGTFHTAFLNARLNIPERDVHIDVKAGRFLAGDKGAKVTVSKFINGVVLSAWYSDTDTTIFRDPYNRGYHEKGISVDVPIRLFTGGDSKTTYRYALSPWTRDVAQDVDHYRTLFDLIGRNVGVCLDRDHESLYRIKR
jgi:hypothetical protein